MIYIMWYNILRDISKRRDIVKYIEKQILLEINKNLKLKDKIILFIFRRYTYIIYRMGYIDGFNFKNLHGIYMEK